MASYLAIMVVGNYQRIEAPTVGVIHPFLIDR